MTACDEAMCARLAMALNGLMGCVTASAAGITCDKGSSMQQACSVIQKTMEWFGAQSVLDELQARRELIGDLSDAPSAHL